MKTLLPETTPPGSVLNENGHKSYQHLEWLDSEEVVLADTGLGTTYERWALNRLLAGLHSRLHFSSLLEGPGDGMTGIMGLNSLVLGRAGVEVSLLLPQKPRQVYLARHVWQAYAPKAHFQTYEYWDTSRLPFEEGEFDLVWNFNVMAGQPDSPGLLAELKRVSQKYVLICVPNRRNYAFWLHRLHHKVDGEPWEHGLLRWMDPASWKAQFIELGMEVLQVEYLDCPWWPDIVDPAQLIRDFFPFLKSLTPRMSPESRYRWEYTDLPYYCPPAYQEVHQRMARLAYIENSGMAWLKRLFGHHVAILARKV